MPFIKNEEKKKIIKVNLINIVELHSKLAKALYGKIDKQQTILFFFAVNFKLLLKHHVRHG